jgi:hypothetical protein
MDCNESIILGRVLGLSNDKIHQNQELYSTDGISPTLKATHYKDPPKVLEGNYDYSLFHNTK